MPNGDGGRKSAGKRSTDYHPDWCNERHDRIDRRLEEIWGEEHGGIQAVWRKVDRLNQKLWALLIGQVAILGGILAIFIRNSIG